MLAFPQICNLNKILCAVWNRDKFTDQNYLKISQQTRNKYEHSDYVIMTINDFTFLSF